MKHIALLLTIGLGLSLMTACKKDEIRAIYTPTTFSSSALTASSTTLVLDSTNAANTTAVTFNWHSVNFGTGILPTYSLDFDVPTDSFKSPNTVILGNSLTTTYNVQDFNKLVYQALGLPANTTSTVLVRVRADVNQNNGASSTVPTIFSDTLTMTVTPYQIILIFPSLWVPGDYQGWNPPTAPELASVKSNNAYEGYVYIPAGGTYQFKFTSVNSWSGTNYGYASATTMSTSGSAGNLYVSGAGYYRMEANTVQLTWSTTATTWAIIGDAPIASNNWGNDVPMTYNVGPGTWTVTTACNAGGFKFRANGDWSNPLNNFGDNAPADGIPDYNGSNITIPVAGTYTFTLNLSTAGNYIYTVKKN